VRIAGMLLAGFLLLLFLTHNDSEPTKQPSGSLDDSNAPLAKSGIDQSTPVSASPQAAETESAPPEQPKPTGPQRDISAEDANRLLVELAARSLQENKRADLLVDGDNHKLKPGEFTFLDELAEVIEVDPDSVQVEFVDSKRIAFMTGVDAATVRKGNQYQFGLVQAIGHQYYDSILGAGNSSIVLAVISDAMWNDAVQAARDQLNESTAAEAMSKIQQLTKQIESLEPEEWGMGKYARKATFVDLNEDQLTLRKADGEEITVPIKRLEKKSLQRAQQRDKTLNRWLAQIRRLQRQHDLPADQDR